MKKVALASAILALMAGAASAERPFPRVEGHGYGKQVQVPAGSIYTNRDLSRLSIEKTTPVTVALFVNKTEGTYQPHRGGL
ncbi:MAG: hypothetical protein KGK00_00015 [Paracoccaceae bacterium]|nr:hypothetical protein [Paracoccaceae bacterium]MDE3241036.1 hypothetical protein [Paracoccaceae bacterium]